MFIMNGGVPELTEGRPSPDSAVCKSLLLMDSTESRCLTAAPGIWKPGFFFLRENKYENDIR